MKIKSRGLTFTEACMNQLNDFLIFNIPSVGLFISLFKRNYPEFYQNEDNTIIYKKLKKFYKDVLQDVIQHKDLITDENIKNNINYISPDESI
jgi:hypothetical protein